MLESDQSKALVVVAAAAGVALLVWGLSRKKAEMGQKSSKGDATMGALDVVGGHGSKKGKGAPILVRDGSVFKPFQPAQKGKQKSRGELEADFYKEVSESNHPIKPFIPEYHGTEEFEDGVTYLKLGNLLQGIKSACILDLKMGQQTYDESASAEKIAKERKKYPPQEVIGFRCSGMKVIRPASGETFKATRDWCMSITPESMQNSLERFFFDGRVIKRDLIVQLLEHLEQIEKMLRATPTWRMYGSSLLIVYDAAAQVPKVRVKMIDFAHIFRIKDGGLDDGYLHGIKFLSNCLRLTLANTLDNKSGSVPAQVGGAHNNIASTGGELTKKEDKAESFNIEVDFYRKAWGVHQTSSSSSPDPLSKVMPKLIRVNETSKPREMVISDATMLVNPPSLSSSSNQAVSIMDVKLGKRSFRSDCPNEPKESYYNKYATFEQSLAPGRAEAIWKSICGLKDGPECLTEGKLGKRDYLSFRDATTTSLELGFRLTALVHGDYRVSQSDSRSIATRVEFLEALEHFLYTERGFDSNVANAFLQELDKVIEAASNSKLFKQYELVGSSLLFLHCDGKAAIRWIDFANSLPSNVADGNNVLEGIRRLSMAIEELTEKYKS